MMELFDQAVWAGEAQRASGTGERATVFPALKGCVDCGTLAMIASPMLGTCSDCGADLTIVAVEQP